MVKRYLARRGVEYERVNWLEGWQERADFDPVSHLPLLGEIYSNLNAIERQAVFASGMDVQSSRLETFRHELKAFMDRFGHLSDSGHDFSFPLWEETPEVVLNLIAGFANTPSAEKSESHTTAESALDYSGFLLKRAMRYSCYREQISFLYTRGFSMFRVAYQRIGTDFCASGWLDASEDIFFLEHDDIVATIRQEAPADLLRELVQKRKDDHVRYASVTLPPVIYGEQLPPILNPTSVALSGIPTSRGLHRGVVRVVKGISDFPKVTDACVLVIPYSDVSWTPLFARAGALVAEAGGMLSHSSIVAREYGIPAIVSVPNATHLKDGIEVTVDGYTGNIIVHDSQLTEEAL